MTVTAIVQRYYPERLSYLYPILESLASQTVKPTRVILWNNFHVLERIPQGVRGDLPFDLHIIHSSENTLMGRWAAVLLAETEYILILDDDLTLAGDVVEKLLKVSKEQHGALIGPFGMRFGEDSDKPYTSGKSIREGRADVLLGRCMLASRLCFLARLWNNEKRMPFGRNDDIYLSDQSGWVVPDCGFTNLDEKGQGLSHQPEHFPERDLAARAVIALRYELSHSRQTAI